MGGILEILNFLISFNKHLSERHIIVWSSSRLFMQAGKQLRNDGS